MKLCLECKIKISKNAIRCRPCAGIQHSKDISGENNPRFIDGRTNIEVFCLDCKKILNKTAFVLKNKRCKKCASIKFGQMYVGINHPSFINGKWSIGTKNYCKCGKEIWGISSTCSSCRTISKNTRIKMSRNHCDVSGKNNPMFGKPSPHGKWTKYKGIKFRSTYEAKYAKFLDKNKIKWKYEYKTFDLGNCTYTPDFYLLQTDEYIEVKGYWRGDARSKYLKFRRRYLKIKIKIINKNHLKKLGVL